MERIDGDQLDGVSATTLWTLRNRAEEAMRADSSFDDPLAVEAYRAIDTDFTRFGKPSQTHPLRALAVDQEIRDYLVQHLADLGRHPEINPQFVGRDSLLAFVSPERGLTLTSEATTAMQMPGISYRPMRNEILPFSAVWSAKNNNPAADKLLNLARSMASSKTGT